MKRNLLRAFLGLAVAGWSASSAHAQLPPYFQRTDAPVVQAQGAAPVAVDNGVPAGDMVEFGDVGPRVPRVWGSLDYIRRQLKDAPNNTPLLSTSTDPAAALNPGALNEPTTRIVIGGNDIDLGSANGFQAAFGAWWDADAILGFEVGGFALERRLAQFTAVSDDMGQPFLAVPFFDLGIDADQIFTVAGANPFGAQTGGAQLTNTIRLWGIDANALYNVARTESFELSFLAGFRYADLLENTVFSVQTQDPILFADGVFIQDKFQTRNQFVGGQIGARASVVLDRVTFDATGKLAFGNNRQSQNVEGFIDGPGDANDNFNGGLFTQATNVGRTQRNHFSFLPEINLKAGFRVTQAFRITAGYDWMYWTDVVRPGDQINNRINRSQNVFFGGVPGQPTGPAGPNTTYNLSDFWSHGLSVGGELKF